MKSVGFLLLLIPAVAIAEYNLLVRVKYKEVTHNADGTRYTDAGVTEAIVYRQDESIGAKRLVVARSAKPRGKRRTIRLITKVHEGEQIRVTLRECDLFAFCSDIVEQWKQAPISDGKRPGVPKNVKIDM